MSDQRASIRIRRGVHTPTNILLLTIDALRPDYLSCYGFPHPTSPNIDQLALKGLLFRDAFANGPGTPYSFPSLLSSENVLSYGSAINNFGPPRVSVAEVLQNAGYATAAFQSNSWLASLNGYSRGFDEYHEFYEPSRDWRNRLQWNRSRITDDSALSDKLRASAVDQIDSLYRAMGLDSITHSDDDSDTDQLHWQRRVLSYLPQRSKPLLRRLFNYYKSRRHKVQEEDWTRNKANLAKPYASAAELADHATRWLEENHSKRFFLWVHFMDVHPPYCPGESGTWPYEMHRYFDAMGLEMPPLQDANPKLGQSRTPLDSLKKLYMATIRYTDEAVGQILAAVERLGLSPTTLTILTSDHGSAFNEHGFFDDLAANLYDERLRVPLILTQPRQIPSGQSTELLCSLADVAPTMCDLINMVPPEEFKGRSLLQPLQAGSTTETHIIAETLEDVTKAGFIGTMLEIDKKILCVRTTEWKLIWQVDDSRIELYNVAKDPGETTDVSDHHQEVVDSLFEILKKRLSKIEETQSHPRIARDELSRTERERIEKQLRALGYID